MLITLTAGVSSEVSAFAFRLSICPPPPRGGSGSCFPSALPSLALPPLASSLPSETYKILFNSLHPRQSFTLHVESNNQGSRFKYVVQGREGGWSDETFKGRGEAVPRGWCRGS